LTLPAQRAGGEDKTARIEPSFLLLESVKDQLTSLPAKKKLERYYEPELRVGSETLCLGLKAKI